MSTEAKNLRNSFLEDFDFSAPGRTNFWEGEYSFFQFNSQGQRNFFINELRSYTIYILERSKDCVVQINNQEFRPTVGDSFQFEGINCKFSFDKGHCIFLVSGSNKQPGSKYHDFKRYNDIYKVSKPWGQELWINNEHPLYAFKKIDLTKGSKTSLQYHCQKKETLILMKGRALLHFQREDYNQDYDFSETDIMKTEISPYSIINISPKQVHRLEALTNIELYETSTPEYNDVIRLRDDTNRKNGKIQSEHID
tara:strand:+ start:71265 stop:72023 length:759 start_codon:yes stop_codon:yes gene_type:complete